MKRTDVSQNTIHDPVTFFDFSIFQVECINFTVAKTMHYIYLYVTI